VYYYDVPEQAENHPQSMLLIWRWICFYPLKPENRGESTYHQFKTTNLCQHTITNKKVKDFAVRLPSAQIYMM